MVIDKDKEQAVIEMAVESLEEEVIATLAEMVRDIEELEVENEKILKMKKEFEEVIAYLNKVKVRIGS
jgi:hypothetical protein